MRNWPLKKRLWVGISAATAFIIAISIGIVNFIGSAANPVFTGAPAVVVVTPTEEWGAAEERLRVQEWVSDKLPAYTCSGSDKTRLEHFSRWEDVKFCPDYIVTIQLTGMGADDIPIIIRGEDGMITVEATHRVDWPNNSDTNSQWLEMEYWSFAVTFHPSVTPAGYNLHYQYSLDAADNYWMGLAAYGYKAFVIPANVGVTDIEIYAASPDSAVVSAPIDPVKIRRPL